MTNTENQSSNPRRLAALYARVSSERQKDERTIDSQVSALLRYADEHGLTVPEGWIFKDDGVSGYMCQRPQLDALRDLVARGGPDVIVIWDPDRLSRRYVYTVLLVEEFQRHGVEVRFCQAEHANTDQERLLQHFKSAFAEYERAQIAERCRRGRLYKAQQGSLTILPNAPYGYRYIREEGTSSAYYVVEPGESETVRTMFRMYACEGKSLHEICNYLKEQGIKPRRSTQGWDPMTIRTMFRNKVYIGVAAFGKTEKYEGNLQRIVRGPKSGRMRTSKYARRLCPEDTWNKIPVPSIVTEYIFGLTQEKLNMAQRFASRNTKKPSILQGLLTCGLCGASYYKKARNSSHTYYCCHRSLKKTERLCGNRSVRQKDLDTYVWEWLISVLKDPKLIEIELQRRLAEDPEMKNQSNKKKELVRELKRIEISRNKLLDAYTTGHCLTIEELQKRMQPLNQHKQRIERELRSLERQISQKEVFHQSQLTLKQFADRLQQSKAALTIREKQTVVRNLIDEIVIRANEIEIKHCIPIGEEVAKKWRIGPLEKLHLMPA